MSKTQERTRNTDNIKQDRMVEIRLCISPQNLIKTIIEIIKDPEFNLLNAVFVCFQRQV
jgi:hypothetical protein